MNKRKVSLAILAIVLVLAMTMSVLVACNDGQKPKQYTVTFADGTTTVDTVTVDSGTALKAEQIPAAPTKTGQEFKGWFIESVQVEAGYKVTGNVTATAKYEPVTAEQASVVFKNGETTVSTVTVDKNSALTAQQIPADPTAPAGQKFDGWFVGTTKVTAGYTVAGNVTATAKFSPIQQQQVTLTFKNGDTTVATLTVDKDTALTAQQIPADPTAPTGDATFDGWYIGTTKVTENYVAAATATVTAKFTRSFPAALRNTYFAENPSKAPISVIISADKIKVGETDVEIEDTTFEDDAWTFTASGKTYMLVNDTYRGWCLELNGTIYTLTVWQAPSFAQEFVGTYEVEGSNPIKTVTITANSIEIKDYSTAIITGVSARQGGGYTVKACYPGEYTSPFEAQIYFDGTQLMYKVGSDDAAKLVEPLGTDPIAVPAEFYGHWNGTGGSGWFAMTYDIIIDATQFKCDSQSNGEYKDWIAVKYDETEKKLTCLDNYGDRKTLTINGDGTIQLKDNGGYVDVTLSAVNTPTPDVTIEDFAGAYIDETNKVSMILTVDDNKLIAWGCGFKGDNFTFDTNSGIVSGTATNNLTATGDGEKINMVYSGTNYTLTKANADPAFAQYAGTWKCDEQNIFMITDSGILGQFGQTGTGGYFYAKLVDKDGSLFVNYKMRPAGTGSTMKEDAITFDGNTLTYKSKTYTKEVVETTVNIVFKNGNEVVKQVTIDKGAALADSDIPGDPTKKGFSFDGWFAGTTEFVEDMTFDASTTFVAQFTRTTYYLTFVCDGMDTVEKALDKVQGGATTIPSGFIPSTLNKDEFTFVGFWSEAGVKAEKDLVVTDDMTFTAYYANEDSYTGTFADDENKMSVFFTQKSDGTPLITVGNRILGQTFTLQNGTITIANGAGLSSKTWTIVALGDKLAMTYKYFDEYEDLIVCDYMLEKGAACDFAGTYVKDSAGTKLVVTDGGIVTDFNGSKQYARIIAEGSAYKLVYVISDSQTTVNEMTVAFDEKGNIVTTDNVGNIQNGYKGLWVKDSSVQASYSCGNVYLYKHVVGSDEQWVYANMEEQVYGYATITGEVADGSIVTLTFDETEYAIKIVNSYKFEFAGAERGTYTGTIDGNAFTMELDGFGGVGGTVVGGATDQGYYLVGEDIVVIGESGAKLNFTDNTFTLLEADGYAGMYKQLNSTSSYTLTLDGYGGAVYANSYSTYIGTYTVDVTAGTVTIEGVYSSVDKIWTLQQDKDVLLAEDGTAYLLDGATVDTKINDFTGANAGWWKNEADENEYLFINVENGTFKLGDLTGTFTANWNGTVLSYKMYNYPNGYDTASFVVEGGKVVATLHLSGVDSEKSFVSAAEPVVEEDAFKGGWTGSTSAGVTMTFYFDGFGKGTFNNGSGPVEMTYTVGANGSVTFTASIFDFTISGTPASGTLTVNWTDGDSDYPAFTVSKAQGDAFTGKWNPPTDASNKYILTFDGFGMVNVYMETSSSIFDKNVKYTFTGNVATFSANWEDWTCTLENDGTMTVKSQDSDGFSSVNATYTKESASDAVVIADEYIGTWEIPGTYGGDKLIITADGVKYEYGYDGAEADCTDLALRSGGGYTFTVSSEYPFSVEIYLKEGAVYCVVADGDEVALEKVVEETLDAFAGTYTSDSNTIIFDGKGAGTYNGTYSFTYTISGNVATLSNFAAYDDGENTATLNDNGTIAMHLSGGFGDDVYNATFTKQ